MQRPVFFIFAVLIALAGCAGTNTRQSTGEYFDDSLTTNRVKRALLYERGVTSTKINVETFRGVVLLSGFVDSHDIAAKAVNATKHVSGVKGVQNHLVVRSDIKTDVKAPSS
jgi:osmotically-inducible protein OsmY